jgi:L-threonylcarbamoyladenylate synthase
LVAFPTDTVYGVGALAFDTDAVERVYWAKERPVEKAIPVLLGAASQIEEVSSDVPPSARLLAARFWPGPLTLVIGKKLTVPRTVAAGATIGVRVPDHGTALALLRVSGPMAVTSANLSGRPSAQTAAQVLAQLDGKVDLILDGGKTPGGMASTVVDCTQTELKILRPGPVSLDDMRAVLASAHAG